MKRTLVLAVPALVLSLAACHDVTEAPLPAISKPAFSLVPGEITITDLGTLGGEPGAALDVNDAGQVVGFSFTPAFERHAFLWQNGTMTDLGTLGGTFASAHGINDAGQVTGISRPAAGGLRGFVWQNGIMTDLGVSVTLADRLVTNELGQIVGSAVFGTLRHAFSWQNGTTTDLGALPGYVRSAALAVNDVGQVVGFSSDPRLVDVRATLWQDGTIIDLDPTGSSSIAIAVNNSGQVLVNGGGGAFIWQNGSRTDLGSLGGGFTDASAINDLGQVVGVSNGHAFLWEDGAMTDLGLVAGGNFSVPPRLNDLGQVAGTVLEGSLESGYFGRTFLWQNGVRTELMRLDGGTESEVIEINNRGQVIGSSEGHVVLWNTLRPATPTEEVSVLNGKVNALCTDGTLNHGQCQSLLARLNVVSTQLANENQKAAANVLGAFINHVRAFVSNGLLSSDAGQPLIDAAQSVIDALST